MFDIEWLQSALNELASAWMNADAELRRDINQAVVRLEKELERNPLDIGESRAGANRICFSAPVAVTYEVHPRLRIVTVLHVRVYRHRRGS